MSLDFRTDTGAVAAVVSATVEVRNGTRTIVAAVAATVAAGVAYVDVAAADTTAESVGPSSSDWFAVWSDVVVGSTTYGPVRQALALAIAPLYAPITDEDLTDESPSLVDLLPPGSTTYEKWRTAAFRRLVRRLKRSGKIAALVLDADSLVDLLVADTLAAIYREHITSIGDARYSQLAEYYAEVAASEWAALAVAYDRHGVGYPTGENGSESPGSAVLYTQRPPRRRLPRTV